MRSIDLIAAPMDASTSARPVGLSCPEMKKRPWWQWSLIGLGAVVWLGGLSVYSVTISVWYTIFYSQRGPIPGQKPKFTIDVFENSGLSLSEQDAQPLPDAGQSERSLNDPAETPHESPSGTGS